MKNILEICQEVADFSKMTTREILEWQYKNKPQIGEECELVGIEKQVWESTLNRSMVLEAENTKLKEELKDYEYQHKQDGICCDDLFCKLELARKENRKLKELLKECREFFYENLYDTEFHFSCGLGSNIKMESCMRSLGKLRIKINQALGEDK